MLSRVFNRKRNHQENSTASHPKFIGVLPDNSAKKRFEKKAKKLSVKLYTQAEANQQEFRKKFQQTFEEGVIYQHHTNPSENMYYPIDQFASQMDDAKHTELYSTLQALGAYKIIISSSMYDEVLLAQEQKVDIHVPKLAGKISATRQQMEEKYNDFSGYLVANFGEPQYQSYRDENVSTWWLDNNKFPGSLQELITKSTKQGFPTTTSYDIEFATTLCSTKVYQLGGEIGEVVGVAREMNKVNQKTTNYKYKVIFHDLDFIKKLNKYESPITRSLSRMSFTHGELAALRFMYRRQAPKFREDLIFHGVGRQMEDAYCDYTESTLLEWFQRLPKSNVVNVPLVFYGPEKSGKTSCISTIQAAVKDAPDVFFKITHDRLVSNMSVVDKRYTTVIRDSRFDASGTGNTERLEGLDKEKYDTLSDYDMAKLAIFDTAPARNVRQDIHGTKYPIGMMILVLDARKLMIDYADELEAFRLGGQAPASQSTTTPASQSTTTSTSQSTTGAQSSTSPSGSQAPASQSTSAPASQSTTTSTSQSTTGAQNSTSPSVPLFADWIKPFLGVQHGKGRIKRYPPIGVILTKVNGNLNFNPEIKDILGRDVGANNEAASNGDDINEKDMENLIGFIKAKAGVQYAWPMPTLVPPSQDFIAAYDAGGDAFRKAMNKHFNKTCIQSIKRLEQIFSAIADHEFLRIHQLYHS